MKTAIEKALDSIRGKSVKVDKMEEPKKDKKGKQDAEICCCYEYDSRPRLYLDDKELSTISKLTAGSKVVLVIECEVTNVNSSTRLNKEKKAEKTYTCDLVINAISDITE